MSKQQQSISKITVSVTFNLRYNSAIIRDGMAKQKQVALFGASGRTGQEVIKSALTKNLHVRAIVRSPVKKPVASTSVTYVNCDLADPRSVKAVVLGTDSVVIVFGPLSPYKDIFCAEATTNIVLAMKQLGMKRLICQTGAMIGDFPGNRSPVFELFSKLNRHQSPLAYGDRVNQEKDIRESPLDWTIIKPPRLKDSPALSSVTVGKDVRVGLMSSVSRSALGRFIVTELLRPQYVHQAVFVKGK